MFHLLRSMATHAGPKLNRLKLEKSPYLLQHASNPVEWYSWGEEAFEAARKGKKVIFLSIGYSTCHWCHVMEKESFENVETANIMNKHFINIKVDREERPDVDKVYMSFITELTGSGGWPLSVWLTPDLKPIYGGTYYAPDDRYIGMQPSFPTMLNAISSKWEKDPVKFINLGEKVIAGLNKQTEKDLGVEGIESITQEVIVRCAMQLADRFDPKYGGFTPAPKFPRPCCLNFLFAYKAMYPNSEEAEATYKMAVHTLFMMGKGGIHDHVAQGFARYSTDEEWHVPHFEKMLYDQAQLVHSYLDAYLATKKACFADLAGDILTYVIRDLSHKEGGFFSAEDADSFPTDESAEKIEGAFCVWERMEIEDLLQEKVGNSDISIADIFCYRFSVSSGGNVDSKNDHHGNFTNKNVLIIRSSIDEIADKFGIDEQMCNSALKKGCQILREARKKRPKPHLDDKMVTAWNGMMLSAMARAGAVLGNKEYIEIAIKNANFIKKYLYRNGKLIRTAYRSDDGGISLGSEIDAFSADYAWLIHGLVNLYFATLDCEWLVWAECLQDQQRELFWDEENGGFFLSKETDSSILLRLKDDNDGAEPSVNSVSAGNLVRLNRLLNRPDFEKQAVSIFELFTHTLSTAPMHLPEMVVSLMLHNNQAEQIICSGNRDSLELKEMLSAVHSSTSNPNRIILIADSNEESILYKKQQNLIRYKPKKEGKVSVYVCKDFMCSLPAKTVEELTKTMKKNAHIF